MIKALVFDVYGTLLDTRGCSLVIMKDVLKRCSCSLKPSFVYSEWRKDIEDMINKMDSKRKYKVESVFFKEALGRTLKKLNVKGSEKEKMRLYSELCWGNRTIFPEVLEALKALKKKYKIIVASNSDTKPLKLDFKRNDIKVDKIITSEMLRLYKPHKQFFIGFLKKIRMKKDEVVYIGDTLKNDVIIPKKLGIRAVWVNRKNKKPDKVKVPFSVKNLKELVKLDFS